MASPPERRKALVIALQEPTGTLHGGTLRTAHTVSALRALGFEVEVVAPGSSGIPASAGQARSVGAVGRLKRHFLPMPTSLGARNEPLRDAVVGAGPVDVAVCQVMQQAGLLGEADARVRWLDLSDVQSVFASSEARHRSGAARATALAQARWLAARELRLSRSTDLVTAAGWGDTQQLRRRGIPASWLPTPVAFSPVRPPRVSSPLVFGLLGNFEYWPNVAAYEEVLRWQPVLAQFGTVLVAGRAAQTLPAAPPSVHLLGEVAAVESFYERVDVVLAPVRRGGGMKVKVAEALVFGRPVIASPEALEGFPPEVAELCTTAGSPADLEDFDMARSVALLQGSADILDVLRPPGHRDRMRSLLAEHL